MLLHAWLVHLRCCERVHLSALGSTEVVLEVLVYAASTDEKLLMRQVERLPRHLVLRELLQSDGHFESRYGSRSTDAWHE